MIMPQLHRRKQSDYGMLGEIIFCPAEKIVTRFETTKAVVYKPTRKAIFHFADHRVKKEREQVRKDCLCLSTTWSRTNPMQQAACFPLQCTPISRRQNKIIPQELNRQLKSFDSTLKYEAAAAFITRCIIAKDEKQKEESSGILCRHQIK